MTFRQLFNEFKFEKFKIILSEESSYIPEEHSYIPKKGSYMLKELAYYWKRAVK